MPGYASNFMRESFPPASKYSADEVPDLEGQVAIITGANTGIGKETARVLLDHNAKVYIACRSKTKAEEAIKDLKDATGKEAIFLELDLSDLHSIKRSAEEFSRKETKLHMLYNNAGVFVPPMEMLTAQGYDLQFGTNVLGHFYFTKLLLPVLLSTAKSSPDGKARVLNTSSLVARAAEGLDFETFTDCNARRKMAKQALYAQSKLGNAVFSKELSRLYGDQGLVSVAFNPGNITSDMQRHMNPIMRVGTWMITHPVRLGALTQLWAGTSSEGATMNGKYLIPWACYGPPHPASLDEQLAKDLWTWLEKQVEPI